MNQQKIGLFLKTLRKAKGMSQQDVADALLINQKTVSRWENGDSAPDITILKDVAVLFDVTTDELLDGEKHNKEVSDYTNKKREVDRSLIVKRNVVSSLNVFNYVSLGLFFVLFCLSLIFRFVINNELLEIIFLFIGIVASLIIHFIGLKYINNKLDDSDFVECVDKSIIYKGVKKNSLLFFDIYFLLFIFSLFLIKYAFYDGMFIEYHSIEKLVVITLVYLLNRKFIVSYDKEKFLNRIWLSFVLVSFVPALYLIQVTVTDLVGVSLYPTYSLIFLPFSQLAVKNVIFTYIAYPLIALGLVSAILLTVFKKEKFSLLSILLIYLGVIIIIFDYNSLDKYINFSFSVDYFSLVYLIISILLLISYFVIKKYKTNK